MASLHPPVLRSPLRGRTIVLLGALFLWGAGCGAVGDPIAPEDIGIEAKILERQRAEEQRSAPEGQPNAPRKEPEIVLPPLQPVGTQ